MYVSETVKEALRPYSGQAVQIDAKEGQWWNTLDWCLITRFEILGPVPDNFRWVNINGIRLKSLVRIEPDGKPIAIITIENTNSIAVMVHSEALSFTLLTKRDKKELSYGRSFAGQNFEFGDKPCWKGTDIEAGRPWWTIGKENALAHSFALGPMEKRIVLVHLDLHDGQYDFLCGYGGNICGIQSKCVASNLSAFDVHNGKAKLANVKSR